MAKQPNSLFNMQFITSSISTMLVLLLLGMVVFFVLSANNLSMYVRENIGFTVLMSDDMKEPEALKFQNILNEKAYVKESMYISKEQALKEQTEAMGTDPAEFLGYNPFTASIEIKLNAEYANSDSIIWIEKEILANKKVMEVSYPQDLLDSVNRNIQKVSIFLLGLAALLTLISFALINNTIRLTIYSKRFLIHAMKLVGANWGFIRRPFLIRHMWIGILAGLMADVILIGLASMLVKYEPQLIDIITPQTMLIVMGTVFGFGLAITSTCAYISINKYLRMKASALYYI
ncbi:MAG: permease-like cell division protein FtsX [Bacteroidaceae bacterium]|nr:permease-like cell division protein FtsX [Bacteroidaceae bacterium]